MKDEQVISARAFKQEAVLLPLNILEHVREMALVCDTEHFQIHYANKKFFEQFRMWSGDLIDLIREPSRDMFREKVAMLGGSINSFTIKTDMFRDGECYEITAECLEGQKGMLFIRLISCNEDGWIFRSGELENIFDDVQDQLEFGTWIFDVNIGKPQWSDNMFRLLDLDKSQVSAEISDDFYFSFVDPEDLPALKERMRQFLINRKDTQHTYSIITAKGKRKIILTKVSILKHGENGIERVLGINKDITQRTLLTEELKSANRNLSEKERMIREKEEFLGQGSYEFNIKTGTSTVSNGLLKIYGYNDASADPGISLTEIFDRHFGEEERVKILESFTKLIEKGGEQVLEITATVDGADKNLEVYAKVYHDPQGGFEKIVGTTRDITTIKKLYNELLVFKEDLIEREIRLKHGTWDLDLERKKLSMSDGLYHLLGIENGDAPVDIEYFLHNFAPDGEADKITGMLEDVMSTGIAYVDDVRFRTTTGETLYLEFFSRLVKDRYGNPQRVIGIARDASKLQSYKQELKDQVLRSESVNQQLMQAKQELEIRLTEIEKVNKELRLYKQTMLDKDEFLNQGTWEWDVITNKFEHSRGIYRLFGYYSKEEMKEWDSVGNDIGRHLDEEENKRSQEDWVKILNEADTYLREMGITTIDGIERKLETFGKVFRDDQGSAYKVIGTTRDITQLKEYEQELEVKIDELNRSNKDLEEFAYIASHDLHEPLRKLSTFGQRLMGSAQHELTPVNLDYLSRMLKATDTMRNLIDNLLEFSRVTRGSATYVKVNIGKIIEEVVAEQELRIEETGAMVVIGKMPELELITPQIKQLFNNLLSNALKFVREDVAPEIQFACRKATTEERIRYKLRPGREHYCLSVTDNGIGFEKMYSEKIFQIFQRLHGKSEYTGSGIGLAICRKIAENHKGTIYADSEPGKGSSFTVILPNMP